MSTEHKDIYSLEGRLRPEAGIASLAIPDATTLLDEVKSKVHYLWNPFVDISLVGPNGLRMRLGKGWAYYGVGIPGEDDGQVRTAKHPGGKPAETQEAYDDRQAGILQRCVAYPVWNIYYKETKYNMGLFSEDEARTGNDLGAETPLRDRQQYAGVCAADFLSRYREDYGARVLTPFIGMDGDEQQTVTEIFRLVQPYAYKLTNLRDEETGELRDEETLLYDLADNGPADARIRGARLDGILEKIAHEARRLMLAGVRQAANTARTDWADLLEQLSNSSKGQKGYKKQPSAYDRQVAFLLGEPVPSGIGRPAGESELTKAVNLLTEVVGERRGQSQEGLGFDPAEARQLLAELRAERLALEAARQEPKGRERTKGGQFTAKSEGSNE